MRWPEGPPHLALNPPYLFFCFCFVFVLFCFFAFYFGGFKGQVRWPEGPPHLALNPPYLFFLFVFFFLFSFFLLPFLSLFLIEKKPVFPPKKGFFWFLFTVSLSFSLNLFWPPPFSLSLSLSLCFALVFLSSFLSFFFGFLCLSCFCLFFVLSSVLLFLEKNNMKILNWNSFSSSKCSLFGVSCLVFSLKSLFLISVFSWFWVMFFVQHHCFWFQKTQVEKHIFSKKKGGCNKTGFFMNLCFAKCQKLSFFLAFFFAFFGLFLKKHYKNRHFSTFSKAKNYKKNGIFGSYYLVQVGSYYLVQVDCILKNANLDQIITSKFFVHYFFFQKKRAETPIFIVFFGNRCFRKNKLGPDNNFQKGQTWTR